MEPDSDESEFDDDAEVIDASDVADSECLRGEELCCGSMLEMEARSFWLPCLLGEEPCCSSSGFEMEARSL